MRGRAETHHVRSDKAQMLSFTTLARCNIASKDPRAGTWRFGESERNIDHSRVLASRA